MRGAEANVLFAELASGDVSMLSAQIANLACLRLSSITAGHFAALVRIQMRLCTAAVAVRGHGLAVDVVHEGAALGGQTRDGHGKLDANTVCRCDCGNGTAEVAACLFGEDTDVGGSNGVGSDLGSGSDD